MPPADSAGKSLSRSRPWSSAAITSVAVATPGITSTSSSRHRSITAQAEARGDDETRARRRPPRRPAPAAQPCRHRRDVCLAGDAPDRRRGDRRPERDLGDRQAALGEGRGNRHRSLEVVEHDDRNDATAQKRTQDVVLSHLLPRCGLDQRRRDPVADRLITRRAAERASSGGESSRSLRGRGSRSRARSRRASRGRR